MFFLHRYGVCMCDDAALIIYVLPLWPVLPACICCGLSSVCNFFPLSKGMKLYIILALWTLLGIQVSSNWLLLISIIIAFILCCIYYIYVVAVTCFVACMRLVRDTCALATVVDGVSSPTLLVSVAPFTRVGQGGQRKRCRIFFWYSTGFRLNSFLGTVEWHTYSVGAFCLGFSL